jgi:TolA-binding protein
MKRQLTSILLFSALLVGGASTFVSCTDHESDSAYNTSVSLADAIAKQKSDLTNLNEWLGELKKQQPSLADAIDARIKANLEAMDKGAISELGKYATLDAAIQGSKAYKDLDKKVDEHIKAIEELRKSDLEAAKKFTDELNERLENIEGSVQDLQDRYDMAFDFLMNKKLDNIAINATENPVTGYWNAAFLGSQLNLASSFYGVAAGNKDWNIKEGKVLGKGGNAGYLYVSLNPTELDPSLVKVELVNSQGEPAKGFELGDIEDTDKVLTFGYTRAASKNGFYQIPVIASDPQNDDIALDKGSLKEAAQNILGELKDPKGNDLDLSKIASALYKNNLNNKLQAYTVKASYYLFNPETGKLELKHAVAPTYNVAAFAVKPLSFKFAKDNQYLDKVGAKLSNFVIPSLSSKLAKYINAIDFKVEYDGAKQIDVYTIFATNYFECVQDGDDVVIKGWTQDENGYWVYGDGERYRIHNATVTKVGYDSYGNNQEFVYVIKTTDKTVENLLTSINEQIAGKLTDVKNDINKVVNKWDNLIAKVNPLLNKIGSKFGSANQLLQPTILYKDQNGNPNTLSTLHGRLGTRFVGTGETTLYPTSWTAELLAPAYAKKVYVEGNPEGAKIIVNGVVQTKDTQFDGAINSVTFKATAAGTYTIHYDAVDYSGEVEEKTYSVVVK